MSADPPPLLSAQGLVRHFAVRRGLFGRAGAMIRAVDGVDLSIRSGETLGIVGESGCGKSTLGRLLLRLIAPTAGRVLLDGVDLGTLDPAALRDRRRSLQMIFQDPYSSLNPLMTVAAILAEPLRLHRLAITSRAIDTRVAELLQTVGLDSAHGRRYPHEFSGGQRQRIGIARALAVEPRLIVCDEAVSALDVSVQAQVINLLMELQRRLGLAFVFIAHDLAVVRHIAGRVAVMYLGRIVELAGKDDLFDRPRHPYTRALLRAVPRSSPAAAPGAAPSRAEAPGSVASGAFALPAAAAGPRLLEGDLPDPSAPPSGCRFHTRCPHARQRCRDEEPLLASVGAASDHLAACHYVAEIEAMEETNRSPPVADSATALLTHRLRRLQQAFMREAPSTGEDRS